MKVVLPLLAAALTVQIVADPDGALEPSVLNEVEHAMDRAPSCATNAAPVVCGDVFATNGLSATAIAVSLVSRQDKDGNWMVNGTNFTSEAVKILSSLAGEGSRAVDRKSGNNGIIPTK